MAITVLTVVSDSGNGFTYNKSAILCRAHECRRNLQRVGNTYSVAMRAGLVRAWIEARMELTQREYERKSEPERRVIDLRNRILQIEAKTRPTIEGHRRLSDLRDQLSRIAA